jgi:hypothetical protein
MRTKYDKRLRQLEHAIDAIPVSPETTKAAFQRFRETGELPADKRVSRTVISRAKRGYDVVGDQGSKDWFEAEVRAALENNRNHRPKDPVMNELYDEAVYAPEPLQEVAREVLRALARSGRDPSEPVFAQLGIAVNLPEYGSVGMHLLGFPECLAKRPYVRQAKRLFARYDELRMRVDQDDRHWFERFRAAAWAFWTEGEVPDEPLLLDAVLADAEMKALIRHAEGIDVAELMGAFAACDIPASGERWEAIDRVRQLLRSDSRGP